MIRDLLYRLQALFRRRHMEQDLAEEMDFHAASAPLPDAEAVKEACRDARGVSLLENTARDLRYAARGLWHSPAFTLPALLTLALGLGAAIAIFSVADAVLLQPLAYPQSNRLVELRERIPLLLPTPIPFSAPDIAHVSTSAFAALGSFQEDERDLVTGAGPAARVRTARVSASLFPMLGAQPLLGANFTPAQDAPGHHLALLSHSLWLSQFGGDPAVVGRTVHLDGVEVTIAGVMPAAFDFPPRGLPGDRPAQVFVPMAFTPAELADVADDFDYSVLARLRPGVSLAAAQAQMDAAAPRILQNWTAHGRGLPGLVLQVVVTPLRDAVIAPARLLMELLLGAAALLLLLSCANVANLFLVRASARQRDWSLRAALGASGGRLLRQALTESTLLSLAAAALGLVLAWAGLRALTAAAPATLPQVRAIGLRGGSFTFALVVALIVGPLCGLLPALRARRASLERSLREDAPSLAGARSGARARQALVMAQVAIAFVLVCGAGLLIRSFLRAQNGAPGVSPAGVTTAELLLPQSQFAAAGREPSFFDRLQRVLGAQPGVSAVAVSTALPTETNWQHVFSVAGQTSPPGAPLPNSRHTLVQGRYFAALGIPILQGRAFTPEEALGKSSVVIVNASLARRYWPHGSAVGQRLTWGAGGSAAHWLRIVGVVGDVKQSGLDQPSGFQTYEPYAQVCGGDSLCFSLYLSVRSASPPPLRRLLSTVDAGVPVTNVRGLRSLLDASITPRRFNTLLLAVFGLAALLLAAIGLYGVLAFAVSGRRRELAVRMALGAQPRALARMVVAVGGRLALAGLALGVLAAWLLTLLMRSSFGDLLYGTSALDPLTWIAVAAVLLLVALLAAYVPARRASRIAPVRALREN